MKGFTVTELMITIAIAAILLAIVTPNYQKFIVNNRSQGLSTSLIAALRLARSEAITRGTNVQVCPLNITQNACNSGSSDWKNGWRVWVPNGEIIIKDFPIRLDNYLNFCCGAILEFTSLGTAVPATCSCGGSSNSYFQINPKNCTNVYKIGIDNIGRASVDSGVKCP